MNHAESLEVCVLAVNDHMRKGNDRKASGVLLSYIEKCFATRDLEGVEALLVRFREDGSINITPRHKVSILRACHRYRQQLKEYNACLARWYDDLNAAGLVRLLAGIQYDRE